MSMSNDLPSLRIETAHSIGARLLQKAGLTSEPLDVALAVERHRWTWKPEHVRVVLVAESHVYTSAQDLALRVRRECLPMPAQHAPEEFVRLVYCLGYGEPDVLSGPSDGRNDGTRQFWDMFGRLAATGKQPRSSEGVTWRERIQWKVKTLQTLQARGVWLLDASLHAIYAPGGGRVPPEIKYELHRQWLRYYGTHILSEMLQARRWVIGKTVYDALADVGFSESGWIYQPQAQRSRGVDMETGWADLMKDVGA
jgi:hypothetical protein